ncbi:MAG: AAA family ATPase [Actinomycetota bacterium]|jgi:uncharacterized protein YhaN|nr:AAA family ATPase [Actinomycetota bacterium]
MRIKRIEARRFGALIDTGLTGLGNGLNVVFGPNEAGKSTYTALVRHMLYGFTDKRRAERHYEPADGLRSGLLEFDLDGETWTLERSDGKGGGIAVAVGPNGPANADEFLARVCGGVSDEVYRAVFGFGLSELSQLDSLKSIHSHLHATVAGLSANPRDAYLGLEKEASAFYKPGGSAQPVPKMIRELADKRREIRAERAEAQGSQADRERLRELEDKVSLAGEELAGSRAHLAAIESAIAGVAQLQQERVELERKEIPELQRKLDSLLAAADAVVVDDEALARLDELNELVAHLDMFEGARTQLAASVERLDELESASLEAVERVGDGWDAVSVAAVPTAGQVEDAAEQCAQEYRRALDAHEQAEKGARLAHDREADARVVATTAVASIGVQYEPGVSAVVAQRIEAVDRLLAAAGPSSRGGVLPLVLSLLLSLAGAGLSSWAVWKRDWPIAIVGGVVLLVALVLAVVVVRRRHPSDVSAYLDILGLVDIPSASNGLDIKQTLYAVRDALADHDDVSSAAVDVERVVSDAAAQLKSTETRCQETLTALGLGLAAGDPLTVPSLVRRVREAQGIAREMDRTSAQVTKSHAQCKAFSHRAVQTGVDIVNEEGFSEVSALVRLAAERSRSAAKQSLSREDARREVGIAEKELARRTEHLEGIGLRIAETISGVNIPDVITLADLEAASEGSAREVERLQETHDALRDERSRLGERLAAVADDDTLARLSLEESALVERIRAASEQYATRAVAARLISTTLRRYERDRQPAVVARAASLFEQITQGRYGEVLSPLGEFELTVRGNDAPARGQDQLSTATAEQLYLTLRLAYLESLSGPESALPVLMDVVLVNFDEQRRIETARIITEFAQARQIILFTCQESTLEAFSKADPGHTSLSLDRC